VRELARVTDRLQLPHAAHIHCNNLGYPGNWQTTLSTMQALEGSRGHFAHIQFHSYGGDENEGLSFCSAVDPLVEYLQQHPEITVDIGHVTPGAACSITGDTPFAEHLARLSGGRWFTSDVEQESSCGVIPGDFTPHKTLIHAVQWAIGLEWYLKVKHPWQVAMTSDHPNGGAFTRYPEIIALLMSKNLRDELFAAMPVSLKERSNLHELTREYSLYEVAIVTRAAPAKILGLKDKGHLGVGADADITIYNLQEDKREMFQRPRYVIKAGEVLVEEGEIKGERSGWNFVRGKTHWQNVCDDVKPVKEVKGWFKEHYSLSAEDYVIHAEQLPVELGLLGRGEGERL
jgi:formylmethanofuran dehydrogenase subunit A